MNDQHVKGTVNEVKGQIKENVGHLTGNEHIEHEGMIDRVKGKVQNAVGDLKDAVKDGIDRVLEKDKKH